MDIKKIFGIRETSGELKSPERQSIEQTEDYAFKQVVESKEVYTNKLAVGSRDNIQIATFYGYNPQALFYESNTEFLRVGVGELPNRSIIGWYDSDILVLGVYSSPTDNTILTRLAINGSTSAATLSGRMTANGFTSTADFSGDGIVSAKYQDLTLGVGATSFDVTHNVVNLVGDAGGNIVTSIGGGTSGMLLTIRFNDANVQLVDGATIHLNGAADFFSLADFLLQLVYIDGSWYEVSRSKD